MAVGGVGIEPTLSALRATDALWPIELTPILRLPYSGSIAEHTRLLTTSIMLNLQVLLSDFPPRHPEQPLF